MAVIKTQRPNLGSGSVKFIDGIPFDGLGSAGFGDNDFLIIGDESDNFDLIGGSGHDEIEGGGGNDILKGGDGNGILKGGDGNDDLDGQKGTEKLFGGAGDDILRAGDGYDRLNGGTGNDVFGFYGAGHFQITDFTLGQDLLFFDSAILGIHQLSELVSYITNITDHGFDPVKKTNSFTVDFGPTASIELIGVGVTPSSITADMIIFNL